MICLDYLADTSLSRLTNDIKNIGITQPNPNTIVMFIVFYVILVCFLERNMIRSEVFSVLENSSVQFGTPLPFKRDKKNLRGKIFWF